MLTSYTSSEEENIPCLREFAQTAAYAYFDFDRCHTTGITVITKQA